MRRTGYLVAAICLGVVSSPLLADDEHAFEDSPKKNGASAPMHDEEKCEMMSGKSPEKMKKMMQMRHNHMQAVEKHLANIEDLLKQLVELQKQNSSAQ